MKVLNHHLFCPMQCCTNFIVINKVPKVWHPFPIRTCMSYKLEPFQCHPPSFYSINDYQIYGYFNFLKPTHEEYEDQDILKIELMMEAPQWDLSSPDFGRLEQSMINDMG